MPRRLRASVVVLSVMFAVVGLSVLMFFRDRKISRFPYMAQNLAAADYQSLGSRPGWQTNVLDLGRGLSLRGLVRRPARPGGPFLLFFNGNSGQMLRGGQEVLNRLCADTGWGAAVWAYRGYDGSTGNPSPKALEEDALETYRALLRDEKLEPNAVHVVAFSLGTSIATALVARAKDRPPATLTLLAPLTEIDVGGRFQLRVDRYETLKYLSDIVTPTLIIHGTADQTLPVAGGKLVAERLGPRARFVEIPKSGHFELLDSEPVAATVRAFIAEHAH